MTRQRVNGAGLDGRTRGAITYYLTYKVNVFVQLVQWKRDTLFT